MKRNFFRFVSCLSVFVFALLIVQPAFAATGDALQFCGGTNGISAPGCQGNESLTNIVGGILNVVFFLSFLLVLFFLVWGGLKWVLAQGEKDAISKARDQVTNSLIGLVVILGSYLLLNLALQLVLGQTLNSIKVVDLKTAVLGQ